MQSSFQNLSMSGDRMGKRPHLGLKSLDTLRKSMMEQDVTSQRRGSSKQCRDPHHIWSNRHPLCVISSTDVKYPTSVAAKQKTHFLETHFWDPPKERLRKKKAAALEALVDAFFQSPCSTVTTPSTTGPQTWTNYDWVIQST